MSKPKWVVLDVTKKGWRDAPSVWKGDTEEEAKAAKADLQAKNPGNVYQVEDYAKLSRSSANWYFGHGGSRGQE